MLIPLKKEIAGLELELRKLRAQEVKLNTSVKN
jgi:hypothetical protein